MKLSIIIVSWNVKDKLRDNLAALYQSDSALEFEVFVVDNNSVDGTAGMVRQEFSQVKLIANQDNLGFAKANNQALRQVQGQYQLLLNPDTKIYHDTLIKMVDWMNKNPQANLAGCLLVNEQGEIIKHVRRFPAIWDQLAIVIKLPHLFGGILNDYLRNDFDYTKAAKVDSVRGGFFMIRKETLGKIGLLDEQFFVWFEEVDYCKRVAMAGGQVWFTPDAKCVDYVGQSFTQLKRGVTQSYFKDSMLKYFKKWQPGWQYWLLKTAWPIGNLITQLGSLTGFKNRAKT